MGASGDADDGLRVESVGLVLDVKKDHSVEETVDYQVRNLRAAPRALELPAPLPNVRMFHGPGRVALPADRRLTLAANALTQVRAVRSAAAKGTSVRRLVVDPGFDLARKRVFARIAKIEASLMLPPGAKRLAYASVAPTSRVVEGGRVVYRWSYRNRYPERIFVLYNTTPHELSALKRVKRGRADALDVEIEITNHGGTAVNDVRVSENVSAGAFAVVQGEPGFQVVRGKKDPRLAFERRISSIGAGQKALVRYKIRAGASVRKLQSAYVFVGKDLVAASDQPAIR
jgi:hypothetical protein